MRVRFDPDQSIARRRGKVYFTNLLIRKIC